MATMYQLKDRQSLLIGEERVINATGRPIKLLVEHSTLHARLDKQPYPGPGGRRPRVSGETRPGA